MSRIWGVDTLTGLGRTFEAVSLAEVNLSNLVSRVSDLDEWDEHLPVNEAQHLREAAARIQPLREELHQLFTELGEHIHLSYHICDEKFQEVHESDGIRETYTPACQFNRNDLVKYDARLLIVLTKAETLAIEINRQAQTLVTAKYPDYEVPSDDATFVSGYGYGDGILTCVQDLDGSEETGDLSEALQSLVNCSGEDASNLRYLHSYVEQEKKALLGYESAEPVESSKA
jgi:hypothetical protein